MLSLSTTAFLGRLPFQTYLLGDRRVKDLLHKFDFYNVKFMMSEHSATEVLVRYPTANLYWFVDFQREVEELLKKDKTFRKDWKSLLDQLKTEIYVQYTKFHEYLYDTVRKSVGKIMDLYGFYGDREYQAYDVAALIAKMTYNADAACRSGLILSDPRTGKTRVALAVADQLVPMGGTIVIVAPKSACASWANEAVLLNEDCPFSILPIKHATQVSEKKPILSYPDKLNVRIISYELFKVLSDKQWLRLLSPHKKHVMLIGDEVHRMRNFKTKQSQAIYKFKGLCLKQKFRLDIIGTTGTPAVKHSSDVFGLLSMINTSKMSLEPYWTHWDAYCEYFYNCYDSEYGKQVLTTRREAELNFILQGVSVQTKQSELKLFKGYMIQYLRYDIPMDAAQTYAYDELVEKMRYAEVDCRNSLVQLIRLQQICVDPSALLASYGSLAPKLKKVVDFAIRSKTQGLVMSKYTDPLKHLKEVLLENGVPCEMLIGAVNAEDREKIKADFNAGKYKILLMQIDVGKESLTLPAAGYTLFLDRSYTPGVNTQAEMRMAPVDGKACTKYVVDLVMKDTVEERIHNILVTRKSAIRSVNSVFDFEGKEGST